MPIDPSIPLGVRPLTPVADPMKSLGEVMSLRDAQQQQQERQQLIQQRQTVIDDDAAIRTVFQQHAQQAQPNPDGSMPDPDINSIIYQLHSMGRSSAALKLQNEIVNQNHVQAETLKNKSDAQATRFKMASDILAAVNDPNSAHDPQQALTLAKQQITNLIGPDLAKNVPDTWDASTRPIIDQLVTEGMDASNRLTQQKDVFDQAQKVLENQRAAINDSRSWDEKQPKLVADHVNLLARQLALAVNDHDWQSGLQASKSAMLGLPDNLQQSVLSRFDTKFSPAAKENARVLGMSPEQQSQEKIEQAKLKDAESARAAQDEPLLTKDAVEMLAQKFARDGLPPPLRGMGKQAIQNNSAVINRAAEVFKGLDVATQAQAFKAYGASIARLQPLLASSEAWANTGGKNLAMFLQQAQKVVDTGSPMVNKPLREISSQVLGSPQMASFNTARTVVVPEFAKLLTSVNLSGVLTDEARSEIDKVLKGDYTYKQLYDSAKILLQDSQNRKDSYQQEINGLKTLMNAAPQIGLPGQTVGVGATPVPAPAGGAGGGPGPGPAARPPMNPRRGQVWKAPTGPTWFDGTNWIHDFKDAPELSKQAAGVR